MVMVPTHMLRPCPIPEWDGRVYEDVVILAEARKKALKDCNDDKAAARKYQEEARKLGS